MTNSDSFKEVLTIKDEWKTRDEIYRLVDVGAGPMRLQKHVGTDSTKLQKMSDGKWVDESSCYQWGVLTHRIEQLTKKVKIMTSDGNDHINPHTYTVSYSVKDKAYIATSPSLPNIRAFGKTEEEALMFLSNTVKNGLQIFPKERTIVNDHYDKKPDKL